ncbi:MAG: molybdopterin-dependent oxidoreductase [Oscillospiraceae bacterium]|nr:molybdopterin-dependent oxidoreductase [Oscillospiraceae bacterium]
MKSKKTVFTAIAVVIIAVLIMINRNSTQQQIDMANAMQLQFEINGEEKVYNYNENNESYTTFDTQMKRKNGDVFDKNFSGIMLKNILAEIDVTVSDNTAVTVVCADQYEIQLTADEVNADGNIYLITKENGEKLAEEDGKFMLVVNRDEFSTRWAKNVVKVKVQ